MYTRGHNRRNKLSPLNAWAFSFACMIGWAAFVIVAREFAVTALRLVAASEGTVISAGMSGKVKTFSSLVILCVMMTPFHSLVLIRPGFTFDVLGTIVMLAVTVWSGGEYFLRHGKLLKLK